MVRISGYEHNEKMGQRACTGQGSMCIYPIKEEAEPALAKSIQLQPTFFCFLCFSEKFHRSISIHF